MTISCLSDLLFAQMREFFCAERQLTTALPVLCGFATHPSMRSLLKADCQETKSHGARLDQILRECDVPFGAHDCQAMAGLLDGGNAQLAATASPEVRDLMVISHALRIKNFEIAACDAALDLAETLGFIRLASTLVGILYEKRAARSDFKKVESEMVLRALRPAVAV